MANEVQVQRSTDRALYMTKEGAEERTCEAASCQIRSRTAHRSETRESVPNCTVSRNGSSYLEWMKKTPLVPKAILAVSCPTCHDAPGKMCVLWLGDLRTEPHASRKVAASAAVNQEA